MRTRQELGDPHTPACIEPLRAPAPRPEPGGGEGGWGGERRSAFAFASFPRLALRLPFTL